MRSIPRKLNIGGLVFDVIVVKGDIIGSSGEKLWGQIIHDRGEILLSSKLNPQKMWVVLLHEVIHGIEEVGNFDFGEIQTDRLAHLLFDFLTRNKIGIIQ